MASSSKAQKPKEKMEIKEGSTTGSGRIEPFQTVAVNPNGRRKSFSHGGNLYYQSDEDEDLYFLSTGGTKHENYIRLGAAEAPKAEGGGGSGEPAAPARQPGEIVYPQGEVIDTGPVGGYVQNNQPMYNYYPVTQGQQLNPLVDPNNWLQNPDPRYGLLNSAGLYVNNPQPIGVLT